MKPPSIQAIAAATPAQALRIAVGLVGSQAAMARLLGIAQPSVWKWLDGGKSLPGEHVLKVEAATGISRHQLNPEVFGPEPEQPAAPFHARYARADGART